MSLAVFSETQLPPAFLPSLPFLLLSPGATPSLQPLLPSLLSFWTGSGAAGPALEIKPSSLPGKPRQDRRRHRGLHALQQHFCQVRAPASCPLTISRRTLLSPPAHGHCLPWGGRICQRAGEVTRGHGRPRTGGDSACRTLRQQPVHGGWERGVFVLRPWGGSTGGNPRHEHPSQPAFGGHLSLPKCLLIPWESRSEAGGILWKLGRPSLRLWLAGPSSHWVL